MIVVSEATGYKVLLWEVVGDMYRWRDMGGMVRGDRGRVQVEDELHLHLDPPVLFFENSLAHNSEILVSHDCEQDKKNMSCILGVVLSIDGGMA
jgi:hypothetical protein